MPITLDTLRQALAGAGLKRNVRCPRAHELCDFINAHFPEFEATLEATRFTVSAKQEAIVFDLWSRTGIRLCQPGEIVFEQLATAPEVIVRWTLEQIDFRGPVQDQAL